MQNWTFILLFQDCLLIVCKIEFWEKQQDILGTPRCLLLCGGGKRICLEHVELGCLTERCIIIKEIRDNRGWGNVLETWTLAQRTIHVFKVFAIREFSCCTLITEWGGAYLMLCASLYYLNSAYVLKSVRILHVRTLLWCSSCFALCKCPHNIV